MPDVKRQIRLVTEQKINAAKEPLQEGFPFRNWTVEIYIVNENDPSQLLPASMYDKATYKLHPSFDERQTQIFKNPPFKINEEGWGEFDMTISLTVINNGGTHNVDHDLNFANEHYESTHKVVFKNPKPELISILRESGPVPGDDANGVSKAGKADSKKKSRGNKSIDMEKLADGLQKLGEEDLLQVVQMVHDNKSSETYTKNDVENGEFHVDLYTLPDNLVKMLWDFTAEKGAL